MIATEFGSVSLTNRRFSRRCRPLIASNRRGHRRFGPFWASEGLDSGLAQIDQPLQVLAGRHHRHREVSSHLADGADHLAAQLLDAREHVLDTRAGLAEERIASLLDLGDS